MMVQVLLDLDTHVEQLLEPIVGVAELLSVTSQLHLETESTLPVPVLLQLAGEGAC